jgi:hypothetical protein
MSFVNNFIYKRSAIWEYYKAIRTSKQEIGPPIAKDQKDPMLGASED